MFQLCKLYICIYRKMTLRNQVFKIMSTPKISLNPIPSSSVWIGVT